MTNNKNGNIFYTPKKAKSNSDFELKWNITTILISIFISFCIIFAAGAMNIPVLSDISRALTGKLASMTGGVTPDLPFIGGRQNILFLGVDSNGQGTDPFIGTRSDSTILINIDPFTRTVNIVSIPRDSKVPIDGHGIDKLNAAYAYGGADLAVRTIEQTFGVKINHYVVLNSSGIKDLVDAIGGLNVYVEKRMRYVDRTDHLNIDLYPGYQFLNGKQAEGYVRFRHDAIGGYRKNAKAAVVY